MLGNAVEDKDWDRFRFQFEHYKKLAGEMLTPPVTCWSASLTSTYGKEITGMTEADLIVRKCRATASTMKVLKMHQDSDQPILSYIAQIKAAARQCSFKVKCTCTTTVKCKCTDFTDHMVLYKLAEGLNDMELQEELLT